MIQKLPALILALLVLGVSAQSIEKEKNQPQYVGIFSENGKYGVKDFDNDKILLPAEFDEIDKEIENNFILKNEINRYGLYNSQLQKIVLPLEFDYVSVDIYKREKNEFQEKVLFTIFVNKNGKKGLLDSEYKYIFSVEYDDFLISEDYIIPTKDKRKGVYFFEKTAKNIPVIYKWIEKQYPTDCFTAEKDNKYFLYDHSGRLIAGDNNLVRQFRHPWLNDSQHFKSLEILVVDSNNLQGIYSSALSLFILPVKFNEIIDVFEDLYIVKLNEKWGVINSQNILVIPFEYDGLSFLMPLNKHSLLLAHKNNKYGLIDLANHCITGFVYDDIDDINGGYKVLENGKYAVIDLLGKKISRGAFDEIGCFYDGKCAVFLKDKIGYMDNKGNIIEPIERLSNARGYKKLNDLFNDFVKILKSENYPLLLEFCRDLIPDGYTNEFMRRIQFTYRDFPCHPQQLNDIVEARVKEWIFPLVAFFYELKAAGQLESMQYIHMEKLPVIDNFQGSGPGEFDELKLPLFCTEAAGIFKSKNNEYRFNLGELINVDGYWKSFTGPRKQ